MSKVKYKTSAQNEWNERTHTIKPHRYKKPFFHDLLKDIIPNGQGMSCIELGAMPGNYLAYFYQEYGYSITGLDFSKHTRIFSETMKINGVKDYKFVTADILSFESAKKYDLVCSFGLIEHFDDVGNILQKHTDLVADGGILLITVPNFRYFQWLYHKVFDRDNLNIHNIDAMRPNHIDKYLIDRNFVQHIKQPYGRAHFWYESQQSNRFFNKVRLIVTGFLNSKLSHLSNGKMTAPYQIYLYRKKA